MYVFLDVNSGVKTPILAFILLLELSTGPEVVSSRFQTVEYCLPKAELLKTGFVPSPEVVSSHFKILEYCLPQTKLPN